jgi:hypothetical protein
VQDAVKVTRCKPTVLPRERFGSRSVSLFDGLHNAAVLILSDKQDYSQVDDLRLR